MKYLYADQWKNCILTNEKTAYWPMKKLYTVKWSNCILFCPTVSGCWTPASSCCSVLLFQAAGPQQVHAVLSYCFRLLDPSNSCCSVLLFQAAGPQQVHAVLSYCFRLLDPSKFMLSFFMFQAAGPQQIHAVLSYCFRLLDPSKFMLYDFVLKVYADILARWGLRNQSVHINKHATIPPEHHVAVGKDVWTFYHHECKILTVRYFTGYVSDLFLRGSKN